MSVTQSFTVSSSDPNVVTKNATLINIKSDAELDHFVQHTNAVNSLHPTTLQVSNSANAETISINSSLPVVFVVPYQQQPEQNHPTSIWQTIQSVALILILVVVLFTAIRSIASFFTSSSATTNSQTEIAAATALATELEDVA